jgi:predicted nucleotidyltransferase
MTTTISQSLIDEIIRRVRAATDPERIILFGSAATGTMSRDSDVDLLILEAEPSDARAASVRIADRLRGLGYPFDVIVMSTERYEESKNVVGGLAYPVNRHGRVVYEAA